MGRLYKGKYMIAVYDEDDEWLLTVVDSPRDFAKWLGVPTATANNMVSRNFNGTHSSVLKNGMRFKLHFFAVSE